MKSTVSVLVPVHCGYAGRVGLYNNLYKDSLGNPVQPEWATDTSNTTRQHRMGQYSVPTCTHAVI